MKVSVLFSSSRSHIPLGGDPTKYSAEVSPEGLIEQLREAQTVLRQLSAHDIIALLDAVARAWSRPDHPLATTLRERELSFLTLWMRQRNLERFCDLSLRGDRRCLDEFRTLAADDPRVFKAQPRGLVVHWVAGNVPVLGIISVVQGLLTKNANLVKVPGSDAGLLPLLLESMAEVSCTAPSGRVLQGSVLTNAVCAVYSDRGDLDAGRWLSAAADVRLAWGGREAVEAIMNLPRRFGTEDVIFGPRLSFAVIGAESLGSDEDARQVARRVARDASAFDQRGCNSPHTVFVESGGRTSPSGFAQILAEEMDGIHQRQPLRAIAPSEAMEILTCRAEYTMSGVAWHSEGMGWTVLYSDSDHGLGGPCYARTVFVRPIADIFETVPFCSLNTQTVGFSVGDRRLDLADRLTARGVERCPEVGGMSLYEAPWDGMFPMDRLVRWVSS